MQPIEYLSQVENICISLFKAYHHALTTAAAKQQIFQPQQQHYEHAIEYNSALTHPNKETQTEYNLKLTEAHKELLLANVAAGAVAGSILQIARQCISLAWPGPDPMERMTKGRMIGSQHISSVIWHARNQSLHFEEGMPKNKKTRESIMSLSKDFNIFVDDLDKNPRSLSFEILNILEWYNYESYAKDMIRMLNT